MDSSSGPVRVGVVGVGYWGPKLVRVLAELEDAELCLVADLDPTRLARVARQHPTVQTTPDFQQLLDSDLEAVVVATPIRTHHRLAKAALLAGKHVLVEKPLAATSAECEELIALAAARGLTLMVGHTFEYNPAIRALREIVASGEIGAVYYADLARLNLGQFQPDINVLWDLAPHDLSILLYVLQQDPLAVSARGSAHITPGVHDVAYLEVRFAGELRAHAHLSWLDPCKVRRVTIVGSKKMVVCNDLLELEKIRIYDKGVDRPYETDHFTDFPLTYRYGAVSIPFVPTQEPLQAQCAHFVDCIQSGARPQSDGLAGLKVVRLLEAADRSLRNDGTAERLNVGVFRTNAPATARTNGAGVH